MSVTNSSERSYAPSHIIAAIILCLLLATSVWAQALGNITGTVEDSTGAVIPGATVVITNEETGIVTRVQSRADGTYLAMNLVPGQYRISVEAPGFKRFEIRGLRLNVGTTLTQSIVLGIGVVTETIEVSGQTLMVQTTSGEVGSTVQVEQILEMPMPNRNVFSLVNLVPGAWYRGGADDEPRISIGGGRTQSASALLDGAQNSRGGLGVQNVEMLPPIDSMREFRVEVNNMGAQYGRSSAGLINAVTKSGTNEFHGSLYEFVRNDKFDARGWAADEKPILRRNNFGGTIGGPIIKNKTHFFYNFDAIMNRGSTVQTRSVGLPEFHQGDFSNATALIGGTRKVVPIYDPSSGTGTFTAPKATQLFPGNVIPKSRWDKVAAAIVAGNYIPAPNRTPNNMDNNAGNWQEIVPDILDRNYHTIRLDHELNAKTRGYARYIVSTPDNDLTGYSKGYGVADQDGLQLSNQRHNLSLNVTHLFSPTFIMSFTGGFGRVTIDRKSGACCETNYAEKFGIPEVSRVGGEVFPRINGIGGGLVPVDVIGAAGNANRFAVFNNFDYDLQFTKMAGIHTLKFGFKHQRFQGNDLSRAWPSGQWGFNGRWTKGYNDKGTAIANTGISYADFLLGRLNTVDARAAPNFGNRAQYYAGYFQDDWKVTRNLTLNIGVRYETETPYTEVAGRQNGFSLWERNPLAGQFGIPEGAIGITTFPNRHGKGKYLWHWDKNNWAPRFGFAWRMFGTDNTVLRGGYGIFFGNPYDRNAAQVARAGFDPLYKARHPIPFQFQDGVPVGAMDDIPESELLPTFGNRGTRFPQSTVQFFAEDRVTPYSQNANLSIQHQVRGWLLEIGVLANLGRQVCFANLNLNHIRPEDLPKLAYTPELLLRPWQAFESDMPQIQIMAPNWGISSAWLGTVKVERRLQNGFGIALAYTYTAWIDNLQFVGGDDASFGDNDQIQNLYDLKNERSKSTNSVPHRVVIAPIWDLPFGKARTFGSGWHPVLDGILGGWQLSTIGTIRSGGPFGVNVLDGPLLYLGDASDGKNLRPDLVPGVPMYHPKKGQPRDDGSRGIYWLNAEAFAIPPKYAHGNASRTLPGVLGPAGISFDAMVAKNWRFLERYRLQFRWEMFNFTNTPQWNLPGQSFWNSGFGFIGGAGGRRIMQFGLRLSF